MEITIERYEELIIAEHNYKKLCEVIDEYATSDYCGIGSSELRILRGMLLGKKEAKSE